MAVSRRSPAATPVAAPEPDAETVTGELPRARHGRHRHAPQHRKEEQRLAARTAAVGAAGAIAVGAALGLTAGQLGPESAPVTLQPTGEGVDAAFQDRTERASRGLARGTQPGVASVVPRAAAPAARPSPQGPPSDPLPPTPADCEEYSGNREIGCTLLGEFGFGIDQMPALEALWDKESGWDHTAQNPSSGAYGIPQALPGNKMASVANDWETNPATQIRWGLGYIRDRYGDPQAAWEFSQANGWY